jgi:hypothetical protein
MIDVQTKCQKCGGAFMVELLDGTSKVPPLCPACVAAMTPAPAPTWEDLVLDRLDTIIELLRNPAAAGNSE